VEELRNFFHVSRLIFAAFALWQKDAEHRFFSVRNTYLFSSSRMWAAFPTVLLIVFRNSCTDSRNVEDPASRCEFCINFVIVDSTVFH